MIVPEGPEHGWPAALDWITTALAAIGARGWLVGGCLRDALTGRPVRDVDLALTCAPLPVARAVGRERSLALARLNRETVRLVLPPFGDASAMQLDLAPLHGPSIEADLAARDFRVNALALPLEHRGELFALLAAAAPTPGTSLRAPIPAHLLDPLGGLDDLRDGVLAPASETALRDEPGRIMRAARLAAELRLAPTAALLQGMRDSAEGLATLSGDRLRAELAPLLALPRAATALTLLGDTGALALLFPALPAGAPTTSALACIHASAALQDGGEPVAGLVELAALAPLRAWYAAPLPDGSSRIVALRRALLAHAATAHRAAEDAGEAAGRPPPFAGRERVPLASAERQIVAAVLAELPRWRRLLAEREPTEAELRRLFALMGDPAVDVLAAAAICAVSTGGEASAPAVAARAGDALGRFFGNRDQLVPEPLIGAGELLRELGMAPGPLVGQLFRRLRLAQLDGEITTRDEALALARRVLGEAGGTQG
jgi:poly(A) polymerase